MFRLGISLVLVYWLFLSQKAPPATALKILMAPFNHNSHANLFSASAQILQKRGHDVVVMAHPRFEAMFSKKGIKLFTYKSSVTKTGEDFAKFAFSGAPSPLDMLKLMDSMFRDYSMPMIDEIMTDTSLQTKVEAYKFDIAVVDNGIERLLSLLPLKHNIPYVSLTPLLQSWSIGIPGLPSIEPQQVTPYSDKMSFKERLFNFLMSIMFETMLPPPWIDFDNYVVKYVPNSSIKTARDLYLNSRMWIINWDIQAMGFPKITAPYVRYITGLNAAPANPLPSDIDKMVKESKDGIIVFTMGSLFRRLPEDKLFNFLEAFRRVKQKVFMAYKGDPPKDIPTNVYISPWLPQNDLLGDPKAKLFITHGGHNGAMESLYHGVPMICFPIAGDQANNAHRAIYRGVGLKMDFHTFTPEELVTNIQKILGNTSYTSNIKHLSNVFHSLPNAADEFNYWIEHAATFGTDHLRSQALQLPFYQLFMLDIFAFCIFCLFIAALAGFFICRLCVRRCFRSGEAKRKKE